MRQEAVTLSAEQFSRLFTKEDAKNFLTKEDANNLVTKDYFDERFKSLDDKLDLRFNQLDYKLETSFDDLNNRLDRLTAKVERHEKDINELNLFTVDHAMRLKKLEFRSFN